MKIWSRMQFRETFLDCFSTICYTYYILYTLYTIYYILYIYYTYCKLIFIMTYSINFHSLHKKMCILHAFSVFGCFRESESSRFHRCSMLQWASRGQTTRSHVPTHCNVGQVRERFFGFSWFWNGMVNKKELPGVTATWQIYQDLCSTKVNNTVEICEITTVLCTYYNFRQSNIDCY